MTDRAHVFNWKCLPDWKGPIEALIPDERRSALEMAFLERHAEFIYPDDVSLFEDMCGGIANYDNLVDDFATAFPNQFHHIRMYHCCRPVDTRSYYNHGIRVLDAVSANDQFKEMVIRSGRFPLVTEAHLETAFMELQDSHARHGHVYFGLDDRWLVDCCRLYLEYGSEYMKALAVVVSRESGVDVSAYLAKIGQPAVFEVDIPVDSLCHTDIRELGVEVLYAWAYDIARGPAEPFKNGFSIDFKHDLSPEFIVGHYKPKLEL